ncbi:hypothetical protein Ancab_014405 [Ancistrocladus abbreviatus]
MRSKTVTQSDPHSGAGQQRHSGGSRDNNSGKGVWMHKEQNMINNRGRRGSGNSHLDISGDGSNINEGSGRGRGGNIVGGVGEVGHWGSDNSSIHKSGNGGNFDGGGRRGQVGNMVGGAGEGGRRGSNNSNIQIGGNGGNFGRGGRRGHGVNMVGGAGEGGRRGSDNSNIHIAGSGGNIQIDIGGDDLNISTDRGRRGRGGNSDGGGGGIGSRNSDIDGGDRGSRRGGGSNINGGSKYQPSDFETNGDGRNIHGGGRRVRRVNINGSADIGGDDLNISSGRGRRGRGGNRGRVGGGLRSHRASLEDVVQKYVLPAVLTLLQLTNLFNTEAAYMWTSITAFLVYCMLLILNNDTVLIGHLKLIDIIPYDIDDGMKEKQLRYHSEKLAVVFALISMPLGKPIIVKKNLRMGLVPVEIIGRAMKLRKEKGGRNRLYVAKLSCISQPKD